MAAAWLHCPPAGWLTAALHPRPAAATPRAGPRPQPAVARPWIHWAQPATGRPRPPRPRTRVRPARAPPATATIPSCHVQLLAHRVMMHYSVPKVRIMGRAFPVGIAIHQTVQGELGSANTNPGVQPEKAAGLCREQAHVAVILGMYRFRQESTPASRLVARSSGRHARVFNVVLELRIGRSPHTGHRAPRDQPCIH